MPEVAAVPLAGLRKFVRSREPEERCDTCGAALPGEHAHNFEPGSRRIRCACDSCLTLYAARYKPIPRGVRALPDFQMTDGQWEELMIPISLAFFSYSTPAGRVVALYPGPAGAAESLLGLDAWEELCTANKELSDLQPDVEALLVNRVGAAREYFIVPIDECYKLVGVIRLYWSGLSGGAKVWGEMSRFFQDLHRKALKGNRCPA